MQELTEGFYFQCDVSHVPLQHNATERSNPHGELRIFSSLWTELGTAYRSSWEPRRQTRDTSRADLVVVYVSGRPLKTLDSSVSHGD